jgi:hypothetical protein
MKHTKSFLQISLMLVLLWALAINVNAASTILSINSGDGSTTYVVRDEPALVMNGFDFSALARPVTINAVSINVVQPVLGQPVTVVVYEDPNGGSPQDARIISRTDASIVNTGNVRISVPAATTNATVVWAGFYLPVDFRFAADNSGPSVLTYWAWTPFSSFDLNNLASAAIFGPGDGSAPVSIEMSGKARITLEVTQADGRTDGGTPVQGTILGQQIVGDANTSLAVMQTYEGCSNITFDPQDITISGQGRFNLWCRQETSQMQPGTIGNIGQIPAGVPGFERRGVTYQVSATGDYGDTPGDVQKLRVPVTHCLIPNSGDLERAVIGVAYGVPSAWYILPTQRYGTSICAELTHQGPVSYFVPRTGQENYINADLIFSGFITLNPRPDNIFCNDRVVINWNVKNDGFVATPQTVMRMTNTSVRTGQVTLVSDFTLPSIPPGQTVQFRENAFFAPTSFVNEANRLTFQIDPAAGFTEINEANNTFIIEYLLQASPAGCAPR